MILSAPKADPIVDFIFTNNLYLPSGSAIISATAGLSCGYDGNTNAMRWKSARPKGFCAQLGGSSRHQHAAGDGSDSGADTNAVKRETRGVATLSRRVEHYPNTNRIFSRRNTYGRR